MEQAFYFSLNKYNAVLSFKHIFRDLIQSQADHLTRRIPAHGNAINNIRHLNGVAVMSDNNKLGILAQLK